jgi:two-component system CheB/CheR fusion protein
MVERATSPDSEQLLTYLKQYRGFDFTAYKPSTLARRITHRLTATRTRSYSEYVDYLEVHPDEFSHLFNAILINVTTFFRDPDTFECLRHDVIPAILKAKPEDERIRVWSAGCASGEECYSISMLLAEALGQERYPERVKIYATDVDEEELAIARQASYSDSRMADVPPALRTKYFDRHGTRWSFKKDFRRTVIFGRHDLLDDAPISKVDLLVCRNTLMYFNQEAQAKIISRFHFALRDGGFLVLGKAEMLMNSKSAFSPLDMKQRVFVKVADESAHDRPGYPAPGDARAAMPPSLAPLQEVSFEHDSVAQIVADHLGCVVQANARARELLRISVRDIGRPLQDLDVSYRPVELGSCMDAAHARQQTVELTDVAWHSPTSGQRYFNIQVMPLLDAANVSLGTKIVFSDVTQQHEVQDELQRSRQELHTTGEELQRANEELETTNEELQSTVEELETTNEQLQSTNQELETLNSELQSTNEELERVNQELRQRGMDLSRTNVFLNSILRSVPLGIIVLDNNLLVELWNDVATDAWGLQQDDVQGKPFLELATGLPVEGLREPIMELLASGNRRAEIELPATNRRGQTIHVRVVCANMAAMGDQGRGVILLIQGIGNAVPRQ